MNILKSIKTNESGIEYILRKDFTGIEEKYSEKEKKESKDLSYTARSLLTQLQVGDNFE